ncbi:hypothetical protein [Hoylesella timonensis]|uniref:Uncharacterized protein n=1 Tax=Hoylesella timonensis CRIS 5C-B1 TaxID=679189 RepID=D1VXH7_9BACT|nr:hypothetical protein [Hoylesella timonensis]EFA98137.1 hypothetical protein HMPREF9019_0913 [Hoylesella timonensis CRIS 5C-B1]
MLADLKEYRPAKIDFVLDDKAKDTFKDVMVICKGAKSSKEPLKVFKEKFNCLFPEGELATRQYDAHEIAMIREEYCLKEENDVPKRKQELQETLEAVKAMKKAAEEAYNSILLEIADLAARVKHGTTDFKLSSTETVRIALNGYFLFYSWVDGEMKLVKTQKIPDWDRNGLWSQEDVNREAMKELFEVEFPEVEKPAMDESEIQEEDDDLPFGNED